jgi:hypothetical protein
MDLIQPKDFSVADQDGVERKYILSKFPAVDGREIVAKYPLSSLPKLGEYQINEETMLKLMQYVAVDNAGSPLRLSTRALVNNHVPDFETLMKVEMAMLEYNCSFLRDGRISEYLQGFARKLQESTFQTLTDLLARLSPADKPPTTT